MFTSATLRRSVCPFVVTEQLQKAELVVVVNTRRHSTDYFNDSRSLSISKVNDVFLDFEDLGSTPSSRFSPFVSFLPNVDESVTFAPN